MLQILFSSRRSRESRVNNPSTVKVLIVDDDPLVVDEIQAFLESNGYPCVPCHSGREALERFRDDSAIALVLCDLDMPGLDGIELVQAMQLLSGKQRLFEAILLTGRAEKQDVIKALRAGIADYYQKPVDLNELLDGVKRQEASLVERAGNTHQLSHLNDTLQYLAASIEDLYHDLDKSQQPAPLSSLFERLSPRQLAVAKLVGKGQTNYQIACELGITENTVKLYVSQVLRLTRMHNRTQLALALSPNSGHGRLKTH